MPTLDDARAPAVAPSHRRDPPLVAIGSVGVVAAPTNASFVTSPADTARPVTNGGSAGPELLERLVGSEQAETFGGTRGVSVRPCEHR